MFTWYHYVQRIHKSANGMLYPTNISLKLYNDAQRIQLRIIELKKNRYPRFPVTYMRGTGAYPSPAMQSFTTLAVVTRYGTL